MENPLRTVDNAAALKHSQRAHSSALFTDPENVLEGVPDGHKEKGSKQEAG